MTIFDVFRLEGAEPKGCWYITVLSLELKMTTPHERTRSVIQTRDFLIELTRDTSLPDRLRRDAKFLLRYYPAKSDMAQAGLMEQQTDSIAGLMGPIFGAPDSD